MNFKYLLRFLLINLLIDDFISNKVLSCNEFSKIDSITHVYYKGIAFVITSNGFYYIIREKDINRKDINAFEISGKIPFIANCCDSALIKDMDECQMESDNEHRIDFIKVSHSFHMISIF